MSISVSKRWWYALLAALVAGLLVVALGGRMWQSGLAALLSAAACLAWIAFSSYVRHRHDTPVRRTF